MSLSHTMRRIPSQLAPDVSSAKEQFLYDQSAKEAYGVLRSHVFNAMHKEISENKSTPLTFMKHEGENLLGCACGVIVPGWLHITLMWVEPQFRGLGMGSELLKKLEAESVRLGVHFAYVWTQDFEAPEFYRQHGYSEFIQLHEFGPTQRMFGFRKELTHRKFPPVVQ